MVKPPVVGFTIFFLHYDILIKQNQAESHLPQHIHEKSNKEMYRKFWFKKVLSKRQAKINITPKLAACTEIFPLN